MFAFLSADLDSVFSYRTRQQIAVRDLSLGILERSLQVLVLCGIVFGVLIYGEGYKEGEDSQGPLVTAVSGDAVGVSMGGLVETRYFSSQDLTSSFLENSNVFIATKVIVQQQFRGICEDPEYACMTANDCSKDVGAACSQNNFCVEPSWCPVGDVSQAQAYKLPTEDMRIWVKSAVSFPTLENKVYSMDASRPILYPERGFNTFTVKNLLLLCDPPVRFEEISELGATIEVQIRWECIIGNIFGCQPKLARARRIDVMLDSDNIGFQFKHTVGMGRDQRELQFRSGIRFYFKTIGHGQKVSISEIVLVISIGLSLLALVPIFTDFIMLQFCKQKRKYQARKFVISQDFTDYFEEEGEETGWCSQWACWRVPGLGSAAELGEENVEDEEDRLQDLADAEWQNKMEEADG